MTGSAWTFMATLDVAEVCGIQQSDYILYLLERGESEGREIAPDWA